ncbi:MAG: hypothetical protein J5736_03690, partial [Bacilli bacterium]|nr:hypothetical protein [Bacilli bacterium]
EGSAINRLVSYFAEPYGEKSEKIGLWMKKVNEERKLLTKKAAEENHIDSASPIAYVESNLKEGLNGLLANRIMGELHKPVLVYAEKAGDSSCLVASLRSLPGFVVTDALKEISDYLLAGGGHPLAGGLTIRKSDLPKVREILDDYARKHPSSELKEKPIPIEIQDLNEENLSFLESLAPFGQEWRKPLFLLGDLKVGTFSYSKDGKYLSFAFPNGAKVFSFSLSKSSFAGLERVSLSGEIRPSFFKGDKRVEFLAREIL